MSMRTDIQDGLLDHYREKETYNKGQLAALEWALRIVEDKTRFGVDKVVQAIKEEIQNVNQNKSV